jgi:hypothetical protein
MSQHIPAGDGNMWHRADLCKNGEFWHYQGEGKCFKCGDTVVFLHCKKCKNEVCTTRPKNDEEALGIGDS